MVICVCAGCLDFRFLFIFTSELYLEIFLFKFSDAFQTKAAKKNNFAKVIPTYKNLPNKQLIFVYKIHN